MGEDSLTFPDAPRVELDRLLDELVERAREVLTTQSRLRALLRANQAVVEQLDLPRVLRRIVQVAVELVGAEYGALGVIAPGGGGLEQFIHVGVTKEQAEIIGHLPEGHGLLGALIDDPRPIRLDRITDDPRSAGFPPHHPPMDSFIGVPVRVRSEVYGNLYLTNGSSGSFGPDDEQLLISLAGTAGLAIDNARLFARTKRQEEWSAASAQITARLLDMGQHDSVGLLVSKVLQLSDADFACVTLPTDDPSTLLIEAAQGSGIEALVGTLVSAAGSVAASVLEGRQPRLTEDAGSDSSFCGIVEPGPVMALPLVTSGRMKGAMLVGRTRGRPRFTSAELEMAADFAAQASVAMELARARTDRARMERLEDRARIARDLHDHVIQQLFATGLELQSVIPGIPAGPVADTVSQSVANLDVAISQIRHAIFALSGSGTGEARGLRNRVLEVTNELAPALPRPPTVNFAGAVDVMVTGEMADDAIAVVREALTNVVKHAAASYTTVSVAAVAESVVIEVVDNGGGAPPRGRRSGLTNLEQRAQRRGGQLTFDSRPGGTTLRWEVPIADAVASERMAGVTPE